LTRSISVSELRNKAPLEVQLVDVRTPSEFAVGHIPGAVNIPMDQIEARLRDLCPNYPLVLICQAGTRARITADRLSDREREIAVLEGGTKAWIQSGLPVVACVRTRWSLERQVRLIAGLLVLTGALLAMRTSVKWIYLSAFIGAGLTFAGLTDICGMAIVLAKMPWNRSTNCETAAPNVELGKSHQGLESDV